MNNWDGKTARVLHIYNKELDKVNMQVRNAMFEELLSTAKESFSEGWKAATIWMNENKEGSLLDKEFINANLKAKDEEIKRMYGPELNWFYKSEDIKMKIEKWDIDHIWFTDGSTISYNHHQDCCECNWANFFVLEVFYQDEEFDDFEIIPVNEYGFILSLLKLPTPDPWYYGYTSTKKILIPCYSEQNDYSSGITIMIRGPKREPKDIYLDCKERIY